MIHDYVTHLNNQYDFEDSLKTSLSDITQCLMKNFTIHQTFTGLAPSYVLTSISNLETVMKRVGI